LRGHILRHCAYFSFFSGRTMHTPFMV